MAQRIEVVAAGLASTVALLWLVYVIQMVQSLADAAGVTGTMIFHLNMPAIALLLTVTAVLLAGLSLGAYLHIIHGRRVGAPILWACAGLLIADLAAYDFAGWTVLPIGVAMPYPVSLAMWTGTTIPALLPLLEVLTTSLAVISVLASAAPGIRLQDLARQPHTDASALTLPSAE